MTRGIENMSEEKRSLETSQFRELLAERITSLESSQDTEEDKRIGKSNRNSIVGELMVE